MKLSLSAFAPRGLFTRSLLIITVPIVSLLLIISYVFFDRHWESVSRRLSEAVAANISQTAQLLDSHPEIDEQAIIDLAEQNDWMQITYNKGMFVRTKKREHTILTRLVGSSAKEVIPYPTLTQLAPNHHDIEISVTLPKGLLNVVVPRKRIFTASTFVFIFWMFASAFILLTVAILFLRNQIRPIKRLAEAAEGFGKGIDLPDFRPEGAREVRRAAIAFIEMRDRLQKQITQRTTMLAGVSHDLRTPITRMKLQLALMKDHDGIKDMRADLVEMEQMINAYLDFVRGEGEEENSEIDLTAILKNCFEQSRRLHPEQALTLNIEQPIAFIGRRHALQRAIMNLISNAQHYANEIQISVEQKKDIVIHIDDNGPGIADKDREAVFQPFTRLDPSRNQETGGVGLGLTIARDIARSHGGDIVLESSKTGGLRASLILPR